MNEWMNEWIGGWMNESVDGLMDGWMNWRGEWKFSKFTRDDNAVQYTNTGMCAVDNKISSLSSIPHATNLPQSSISIKSS